MDLSDEALDELEEWDELDDDRPTYASTSPGDLAAIAGASLDELRSCVAGLSGLTSTEQDEIHRICRDLHRQVDDIEIEAEHVT